MGKSLEEKKFTELISLKDNDLDRVYLINLILIETKELKF